MSKASGQRERCEIAPRRHGAGLRLWQLALVGAASSPAAVLANTGLSDDAQILLKWLGFVLIVLLVATAFLILLMVRRRHQRHTPGGVVRRGRAPAPAKRPVGVGVTNRPARASLSGQFDARGAAVDVTAEVSAGQTWMAEVEVDPDQAPPLLTGDHLDTTIAFKVCQDCERIYDISAEFCPRDGAPLHLSEDEMALSLDGEAEVSCPECGDAFEPGSVYCPRDSARLVPVDPNARTFVPVGVVFCPSCHREFTPELGACPYDGERLLPMLGRRTCGLPFNGVGARTRICPECGTRHTADAEFCGRDGHALVNMN